MSQAPSRLQRSTNELFTQKYGLQFMPQFSNRTVLGTDLWKVRKYIQGKKKKKKGKNSTNVLLLYFPKDHF